MVKFKGDSPFAMKIVNSIINPNAKNVRFLDFTFECETIIDAAGHVFVRQRSKEGENETELE